MRTDLSPISLLTRREAVAEAIRLSIGAGVGAALAPLFPWSALDAQSTPLILRTIPSSGEKLPPVGVGTARRFDIATEAEKAPLLDVIRRLPELGGKLVDTAPSYGNAEAVLGELMTTARVRSKLFLATKVSARGSDTTQAAKDMQDSFHRLQTDYVDLMQVWNLGGTETLLPLLRDMKAAKKIRYIGVTTSNERQYAALEQLMRKEPLDFIQVDYAVDNREAADRLLPLARDKGIGVLINLPFGRSRVFQNVLGKAVPGWAAEFDATSWAQIFLKYIVANPAVTCVIPGTAKVEYLLDNQAAGRGKLPNEAMLRRIEALISASA